MINVLRNSTYAKLFTAQVVALVGTGLMTVALGLLAYDLAGESAGAVLGTALAIKMIAYVGWTPIANALTDRLPRKAVLVGADLIRASVALFLPFIDAVWQIYLLILLLQAASATFTPVFQATIPDILEDEAAYTKALSLSRLAYDLENLISPALAGVLLLIMSFHWLFAGTVVGFIASAFLVLKSGIKSRAVESGRSFGERVTRGARIYLLTPRLRGLLSLNLTAAAVGAFVIVNTVLMVRREYQGSEADAALALAAFGAGSMIAAIYLPKLLAKISDRTVMVGAATILAGLAIGHALWWAMAGLPGWHALIILWAAYGCAYSAILTPSGRLLRRSAQQEDRPAIFAAQFALSHLCWLICYPVAGWVGDMAGLSAALLILGTIAAIGVVVALRVWRDPDTAVIMHEHPELEPDHPHFEKYGASHGKHQHVYVIDDLHRHWPTQG